VINVSLLASLDPSARSRARFDHISGLGGITVRVMCSIRAMTNVENVRFSKHDILRVSVRVEARSTMRLFVTIESLMVYRSRSRRHDGTLAFHLAAIERDRSRLLSTWISQIEASI